MNNSNNKLSRAKQDEGKEKVRSAVSVKGEEVRDGVTEREREFCGTVNDLFCDTNEILKKKKLTVDCRLHHNSSSRRGK